VAPQLYADMAVLDATLTLALPPKVTAATGIDAMVHAVEAFTSRHRKNPVSDTLAQKALGLLSGNLLAVINNGQDLAAREAMLLGACLAGQAFSNAPVAAVHALAYPLGGIFHISHGLSNALVLPHVLRFNLPQAADDYATLADGLGAPSGSTEARAAWFIAHLETLAMRSGLERRLRDAGVPESALEQLAQDAMKQTRLLVNNPRALELDDARAIYRAAW
jgi:alcohol dehydrogenase class IV